MLNAARNLADHMCPRRRQQGRLGFMTDIASSKCSTLWPRFSRPPHDRRAHMLAAEVIATAWSRSPRSPSTTQS